MRKSTLIKILLRLVHDYKGEVLIFGRDLKKYHKSRDRPKDCLCSAKKIYFFGDNKRKCSLRSPRKNISDEEIISAAKQAYIIKK